MLVRDLRRILDSADPDGRVWINADDDEWPAACATVENRLAHSGRRDLRLCRSNLEVPASETVLHDDAWIEEG